MRTYRSLSNSRAVVQVEVSGQRRAMPRHRSLLASLLADGASDAEFFCAIGQCLRCEYIVDGRHVRSCLYYPRGGEVVQIASDGHSAVESVC